MRIAFLNERIGGGGAERATINLVNGLAKIEEHSLYLLTGLKESDEYPLNSKVNRVELLKKSLCTDALALRSFLMQNQIDIVVGMGVYANFCVCLANIGIKTKMLISERNSPAHAHISLKSKMLRFLLYRNADAYVFQTQQARAYYSKRIQKQGVVIHNPIKCNLPMRNSMPKKEIVAVGRLIPQKNYKMLLKAMKIVFLRHPEYVLRIFGKGNDLKMLQEDAQTFEIADKVIFEGFCADVHEQIKDSQIFVMSSDFEGMPNALMEAMAMGFPVVTTDCPCGGPSELIENYENGILVPVGDFESMAKEIIHVIENKAFAEQLGNNAKLISKTHSDETILQAWCDLFEKIRS